MADLSKNQIPDFDFIKPFRYLFDNPHGGMNLLFACILMLIPLIGPVVLMGWYGRVLRALAKHDTPVVPALDFNQFVEYLKEGVVAFVVSLIIILPFTLFIFFVVFGGIAMVPLFTQEPEQMRPFLILTAVGVGGVVLLFFMLLLAIFSSAALTRAYLTVDWGKALEFRKIFSYAKATWRSVVIAWVVYLPASLLLMVVGMMALYLGVYPASVIMSVAWLHFMWQIYERYLAGGGEAIAIK
jgi:uncharacterized protein DUF4013